MKRRTAFGSVGVGLLSPTLLGANNASAQSGMPHPQFSEADYEPFRKIAAAKGVKITMNASDAMTAQAVEALHLDMDMVRASLALAIRESRKGNSTITEKLERLARNGTPVQQVEFVMGTGTYYFPEDLEKALSAPAGRVEATGVQCVVCEWVCTTVCNCLGNGDQVCKDRCRNVCSKYC